MDNVCITYMDLANIMSRRELATTSAIKILLVGLSTSTMFVISIFAIFDFIYHWITKKYKNQPRSAIEPNEMKYVAKEAWMEKMDRDCKLCGVFVLVWCVIVSTSGVLQISSLQNYFGLNYLVV